MQRVQCSRCHSAYVSLSKPNAALERHLWQVHLKPKVGIAVAFEIRGNSLRLGGRNLALGNTARDGVRPIRPMKRGQPNSGMLWEATLSLY